MPVDETSQPIELLLAVHRDDRRTLGAQIEDQLRSSIRTGILRPDAEIPSTRDLSRQLGVSRRVVVDAYAQLAAEGYLQLRQGARPRVSRSAALARSPELEPGATEPAPRFNFRPSVPDVSGFPRRAWLRSLRHALTTMADTDLGYGDPLGVMALRVALADYLGRVRGVAAEPGHVVITNGYTQSLGVVCRALAARGCSRIAFEDPSNPEDHEVAERAGLQPVVVPVDEAGVQVDELERARVDAVAVTPAHQHPTGVVMSAERRSSLIAWLSERPAIAIEDDYDAEYRYDRAAIGALQGLDPERVVYAGSASKTLAPALRLGWLVAPPALIDAIAREKLLADRGTARIEQHAFADFLARGELDRHLRRMRNRYRARRDTLVDALADALPEAQIQGVAAGLHVTVKLPDGYDEEAIREQANRRRVAIETLGEFSADGESGGAALVLGYAQLSEPAIARGVRELAEAVRAAREQK